MFFALTPTEMVVVVFAAITALGGVALMSLISRKRHSKTLKDAAKPKNRAKTLSFDFDNNGNFSFADEAGDQFLRDLDFEPGDWARFRAAFLSRFPDLPARPISSTHPTVQRFDAVSPADPGQITMETHSNGFSVQMHPVQSGELSMVADAHQIFAELANIETFRHASDGAPNPIWMTRKNGQVIWANQAYRALDDSLPRNELELKAPLFRLPDLRKEDGPDRISLHDTERNQVHWFEVVSQPCGENILNFAYNIQDTIRAEAAQRNFVQTLAKTFAHLSTGLAVFDRQRQLVLFNPALVDLTRLAPEFLSARPTIFALFDQLRNNSIMPEPKDYGNWRDRVVDVITAATDGNFCETWSLPGNQTFRITGRPHPDGAIAFLFEDISAEVSLTRKFRGDMEVTQSALNALENSIAIFSPTGALIQCNETMMKDWDVPSVSERSDLNVAELSRFWQKKCRPSPVWGDIRDSVVALPEERARWTAEVAHRAGHMVEVQISPIAAGCSVVTLRMKLERASRPRRSKTRTAA